MGLIASGEAENSELGKAELATLEETAASDFLEEIKTGKIPDEPQMPDGPADKDELKKLNLAPGFD